MPGKFEDTAAQRQSNLCGCSERIRQMHRPSRAWRRRKPVHVFTNGRVRGPDELEEDLYQHLPEPGNHSDWSVASGCHQRTG